MKILVTGGAGTVGSYVKMVFGKNKVTLTNKESLDVAKKNEVKKYINKNKPDYIFHFAALTNVDFCEENKKEASEINASGTKNLADVCKLYSIPLVYISTSAVFKGDVLPSDDGYSEDDTPNPANYYGKTKLLGEQAIKNALKKYIIVRAGWMIGGAKKEKKFLSYIINEIKQGKTVFAVDDKFGTITYAKDLLFFIKKLLISKKFGLFHYGSKGICSRYEMAKVVANVVNKRAIIKPVSSDKFSKGFPAPRPTYEILKSIKAPFKEHWKKILKRYLTKEYL